MVTSRRMFEFAKSGIPKSGVLRRVFRQGSVLSLSIVALTAAGTNQMAAGQAKRFVTVGDLQASCETDSPSSTLFCLGMIEGVAGSNAMYQAFDFIPTSWRICPDTLDSQEMRQIFVDWAVENDGEYDRPAVYGIALALRDASPCA